MANCSFCGAEIRVGTGVRLFKKDGSSVVYCSHRCGRYAEMGKKPSKLKWTSRKG
jgi:large subunit ribosomal protein L24e